MNWRTYYTFTFVMISSLLLIYGCKKSTSVNGLVKSYSDDHYIGTSTTDTIYSFMYDGQGRLTQITPDTGVTTTLYYGIGSVTMTSGSAESTYQLNAQGLAAYDDQGNTYLYDNSGHCTNITNANAKTVQSYSISGGNVITGTVTINAGTAQATTTTYSYLYKDTADLRNMGVSFLGKSSTDLINTETVTALSGTTILTYHYTFDGQGRVLTQTVTGGSGSDVKAYHYED